MLLWRTGRVLDWFLKDLRMLRSYPGVRLGTDDMGIGVPGMWARTEPAIGRPILFSFPQPVHPLEAIAAIRGHGGLMKPMLDGHAFLALGEDRANGWLSNTACIAEYLFVTPETVRLLWHLLTPLNVDKCEAPESSDGLREQLLLWEAAGFTGLDLVAVRHKADQARSTLSYRYRREFWRTELGVIPIEL